MKNIQKQYQDLLEGKMSKQNFMRNVRMQFPQHVSPVSSFEDSIKILKGKRILSEAAKPEGVYGHNPNAEAPKEPGIDQLNYYQVYHGIQYELAKMPEITDETYIAARKKVVDTILKDPDAYKELQLANFRAVKAMDKDLEMKEVKPNNLVDKPNEMKVVKKDVKGNTQDTLEKKEKKKSKDAGIKQMTQTPKKAKGIAKVMEVPGKEKSLNESLRGINEALNKDIKAFGQDLDKRFKEAGFDTLVTMQTATPQQLDIVKTNPKAALFEVSQTPEAQMLILHVNPKMATKAESIINKFQFSDYNGPILKRGWTAKQVQGAINPGDIYKQDSDKSKGLWYFYRLAKVNTTVKTQSTSAIQPNQTNLKETVKALKEHILDELTKINPEHEHFNVGARVKKKDNSLVGEIIEWDGDTATVKTDEGQIHHVQGNVITKKDVPSPKEEKAQTGTTDEWASGKTNKEGYMGTPYNSSEDMAVDMLKKGITEEEKEEKKAGLKEKLMKAVKELMYKKGNQTVTASSQQGRNALTQAGYKEVPGTQDVKAI